MSPLCLISSRWCHHDWNADASAAINEIFEQRFLQNHRSSPVSATKKIWRLALNANDYGDEPKGIAPIMSDLSNPCKVDSLLIGFIQIGVDCVVQSVACCWLCPVNERLCRLASKMSPSNIHELSGKLFHARWHNAIGRFFLCGFITFGFFCAFETLTEFPEKSLKMIKKRS